jgi:antitoxin YefM
MKKVTVAKTTEILPKLLEEMSVSHEPIQITGASANGVLMSEKDWRSIQDTLYLMSVPGLRESIQEGMNTPIEHCSTELNW